MVQLNLVKCYEQAFREHRELTALTDYFKKEDFSYYEMAKEIAKLHLLFEKAGIQPDDKIALMGRNNPRWCIAYVATLTYGAILVPILQDFNANDVINILNHSESRLLFIGDQHWDLIEEDRLDTIEAAFSLTDYHGVWEREGSELTDFVANMTKHYRERYKDGFHKEDIKYKEVPNEHIALINYTSGTTGSSKGVILTHNNLVSNVEFAIKEKIYFAGSRTLAFLPLAHAYGCMFDFLTPLAHGSHITLLGKMPTPKILVGAMAEVKPHVICCVPLVLEKIYRKQVAPMLEQGALKYALRIPLLDTAIYSVIRNKLLSAFGGEVHLFIVGGAAINPETEEFLMKIKFPLTVGYGMTECAPLISATIDWTQFKPGSVGKYLKEYCEVKIDSKDPYTIPGEIMVRGEQVMSGYYKNPEATNAVLTEDGWLRTGDIGTIDPDGTIYIKGRCKTMILGPSGQNIFPEEIESKLNTLYLVAESLIVERDGKLVALVYPDYNQAKVDGIADDKIEEILKANLAELNTMVANYEKVASLVVYPTEFEKTPKKSIKRYLYKI